MNKEQEATPKIEIYDEEPAAFNPRIQVAACYIEIDKKLLLLKGAQRKLEGGSWGVPAGKLEANETPQQCACRELFEETGISIAKPIQIHSLGALYMRKPFFDYVYHLFRVVLVKMPNVSLSDEHEQFLWASMQDIQKIQLMAGAQEALHKYHERLNGAISQKFLR